MKTEYEAKFYPIDKAQIQVRLKAVGATLRNPERKMRRAIADKVKYPQFNCNYIRVRDEGNLIRLSAKIHATENGEIEDQKEVDVEVSDFDKTIEIFESIGIEMDMYQETLRETWSLEGVSVEIDTWPGLEPYVEIEGDSVDAVKNAAEKLSLNWENKRITAVTEIFAEKYGLTVEEALNKLKYITFEKIPFGK